MCRPPEGGRERGGWKGERRVRLRGVECRREGSKRRGRRKRGERSQKKRRRE